jgi:hypothetical protein
MSLQRIVIVGCSGSGKSTLARKLGTQLGLPVVHLDVFYYRRGWKKSTEAEFRQRVAAAHRGEAWISEGNFATSTFDIRLPRAEAIIALQRPRWHCLLRAIATDQNGALARLCSLGDCHRHIPVLSGGEALREPKGPSAPNWLFSPRAGRGDRRLDRASGLETLRHALSGAAKARLAQRST